MCRYCFVGIWLVFSRYFDPYKNSSQHTQFLALIDKFYYMIQALGTGNLAKVALFACRG